MIDFLKTSRRFILIIAVFFSFSLVTKLKVLFGGTTAIQPRDWLDILLYILPLILLLISFIPTKQSKYMKDLIQSGSCTIIDVRTPAEYMGGHVAGSKNIPLNEVPARVAEFKNMQQPIILCCASGMRSAQATSLLRQEGLDCYNGGPWTSVNAMTA